MAHSFLSETQSNHGVDLVELQKHRTFKSTFDEWCYRVMFFCPPEQFPAKSVFLTTESDNITGWAEITGLTVELIEPVFTKVVLNQFPASEIVFEKYFKCSKWDDDVDVPVQLVTSICGFLFRQSEWVSQKSGKQQGQHGSEKLERHLQHWKPTCGCTSVSKAIQGARSWIKQTLFVSFVTLP